MSKRKWILIGGATAAVVALWSGVPLTTVLLICLVLACPAAMYFGMRGRNMEEKQTDRKELSEEPRRDQDAGSRKTA